MEAVLTEIKMALKKFGTNSKIYAFTTENLSGYFASLKLKDKTILTVGGSGDHVINSYLYGAKEVTAFDINIYAKYYADLKIIALKNLAFDEFKEFFMRNNYSKTMNLNIYNNKLRYKLNKDSKTFFDFHYSIDRTGYNLRESCIFNNEYDNNELKISINPYLHSEKKYNLVKEKIKNQDIKWIQSDIQNISNKLNNIYDVILLSNISDYANSLYPDDKTYLEKYYLKTIIPLIYNLDPKGTICSAYIYDVNSIEYRTDIDDTKIRNSVLTKLGFDYTQINFPSVIKGKQDAVILLHKNGG